MTKKIKTASPQAVNTAVTNPGAIFNNIKLPDAEGKKGPKIETCEVGMFRLPGIKLDLDQFTEAEQKEMEEFAKESGAFVGNDGLYSWKNAGKRDWFILKYS
jgi:hypothetical protein